MSGRRWPSSPIAATVDEERKEEAPTAYYTAQDIRARVEALLGEMKLAKCADTQVGGTDPLYTAVRVCFFCVRVVLACLVGGWEVMRGFEV